MSLTETSGRVHVTWLPSGEVAPSLLVRLVADVVGTADGVAVVHACRACGSDRHGKPHVVVPRGSAPAFVSLSRSGGRCAVAVTRVGPVGIDIEARGPLASDDLRAWVRAESLVKATGHGITTDPTSIDAAHRTIDLDSPDGFVGALTVMTPTQGQVSSPSVVTVTRG